MPLLSEINAGDQVTVGFYARTVSTERSDGKGIIGVRFQENAAPYGGFGDTNVLVGAEWEWYEVSARADKRIRKADAIVAQVAWLGVLPATLGLLLGLAIGLLSRVLPGQVTLLLVGFLAAGVALFLGALEFTPKAPRERLAQMDGAMPRLGAMPSGCAFHPRCPQAQERCHTARPALEQSGPTQAACWYPHPRP